MKENKIHLIGNAHLDPVWLWTWQDGCAEVLQTFRSALDRLNEYDSLIFTCSSAKYYKWVEEQDSEMFEEIKQRVREGRWLIVGGWYVQSDCNIPSGESFARQALYSQLYYYEKFGIICRTGYNVDSFGHNANLPQLLRKSGMTSYVMMRPDKRENSDIPEDLFWWQGVDGSRVLTYRINNSYCPTGSRAITEAVEEYEKRREAKQHDFMLFYGVGNHGGGPTKADVDCLSAMQAEKPYLSFSDPDTFFSQSLNSMLDLPVWADEMQHHASGCYSATSMIKQLNRRAERLLYSAEVFDTLAARLTGCEAKSERIKKAWADVSFNQFHDILCGCCISEAYTDARDSLGRAIQEASEVLNSALLKIGSRVDTWLDSVGEPCDTTVRHLSSHKFPMPVLVYNPLSHEVVTEVRSYGASKKVTDYRGVEVLSQNVRSSRSNDSHADTVFQARVPAMGYSLYWMSGDADYSFEQADYSKEPLCVENEYIRAAFDETSGGIIQLIAKQEGFDFAAKGALGIPTVYRDDKTDTWAHNVFVLGEEPLPMKLDSLELIEKGEVRSVVRAKYSFGESHLTQDFILAQGSKYLKVKCKAMWQEPFSILRLPFDIGGRQAVCTSSIPSAFIKRSCEGTEEVSGEWFDVTTVFDNKKYGLSLITDSKHSYCCRDSLLALTALRNVIFADHYSARPKALFDFTDEGKQLFEYAVYPHCGDAESSDVARLSEEFNNRVIAVREGYHRGSLAQNFGFVDIDKDNLRLQAFKLCEDNSGDIVMRIAETKGQSFTRAKIMLDTIDAGFYSDFRPLEIKTFRINSEGFVSEVNFLENIIR